MILIFWRGDRERKTRSHSSQKRTQGEIAMLDVEKEASQTRCKSRLRNTPWLSDTLFAQPNEPVAARFLDQRVHRSSRAWLARLQGKMRLVRRAKRGSWYHPPLARLISCAIRIHRPRGSSDQPSEVLARNKDIAWSRQIAPPAYSIHLQTVLGFYIGRTTARDYLFQTWFVA